MPADGESKAHAPISATNPPVPDRRRDPLFRSLIDEMMQQLRELKAHAGPWPADERAKAEADLERIMAQVRNAALKTGE